MDTDRKAVIAERVVFISCELGVAFVAKFGTGFRGEQLGTIHTICEGKQHAGISCVLKISWWLVLYCECVFELRDSCGWGKRIVGGFQVVQRLNPFGFG